MWEVVTKVGQKGKVIGGKEINREAEYWQDHLRDIEGTRMLLSENVSRQKTQSGTKHEVLALLVLLSSL